MTFNTFSFYLFFIVTVVVHYLVPKRWRWIWLLIASYTFYGLSDIRFILVLLILTALSYLAGVLIGKQKNRQARKAWMLISVVLIAAILILFKYLNFLLGSLSALMASAGLQWH